MTDKSAYLMNGEHKIGKKRSFLGIGFDYNVPIDVVGLHFLGNIMEDFHLLIVDEFLKINGCDEGYVKRAMKHI